MIQAISPGLNDDACAASGDVDDDDGSNIMMMKLIYDFYQIVNRI